MRGISQRLPLFMKLLKCCRGNKAIDTVISVPVLIVSTSLSLCEIWAFLTQVIVITQKTQMFALPTIFILVDGSVMIRVLLPGETTSRSSESVTPSLSIFDEISIAIT